MILSCLIVLVRYDGVTVLAGLVQLLDQCMREGQESKASFGDFCLHEASACAARCNHVQLLDQCMREGQESRASFADFCFHGASACAAQCDHSPDTSTMTKWFYSTRLETTGKNCFHGESAFAARRDHVQLLDQCMRKGQESRTSYEDFCFHGA